jgi:hypothetical protein
MKRTNNPTEAPYLYYFIELSNNWSKPTSLNAMLDKYKKEFGVDEEDALFAFYLEYDNYDLKKSYSSEDLIVRQRYGLKDTWKLNYLVKEKKDIEHLCTGKTAGTNNRLRCRNHATVGSFCPQHAPTFKTSDTISRINDEKDIEKLRSVCYILAKNYPEIFPLVLSKAKEHRRNKIIYDKIDELQKEIDNLRRELL